MFNGLNFIYTLCSMTVIMYGLHIRMLLYYTFDNFQGQIIFSHFSIETHKHVYAYASTLTIFYASTLACKLNGHYV